MQVAILFPRVPTPAIEERYAILQTKLVVTRALQGAEVIEFDLSESAASVVARTPAGVLLVVTDPLLATDTATVKNLVAMLEHDRGTTAVVASLNASTNAAQVRTVEPYLTLRQLETAEAAGNSEPAPAPVTIAWNDSDPVLYAARREVLAATSRPLTHALDHQAVTIDRSGYAHHFASLRGQLRTDLLELVDTKARSILEFGCGEGALGAALKQRQACRVTGIEMEESAASMARQKLDSVLIGDVRTLIATTPERYDFIVGGDIVEHLDDPWTFLRALRGATLPGGRLLLSLPNLSCWPIIEDLLIGRFDYVYMGITCVGHLRFFTRRTIEDMLEISGWKKVSILPQASFATPAFDRLEEKLRLAGIEYSRDDLLAPGWYVLAENRE